ncbi:hypothetical protein L798_01692 [Zootermopsis nevadensis]|uniref:Uncharacterized protein n=1 Tax=Zootermopsis nevadensis TaxID=136037 RepID=A0A067RLQ3_ZOONE|nr:hypothetical protein L798_01692 [Zootermopsis nevadensis]
MDHPQYSLDLSLCNFHMFIPLKKALKDHRFGLDVKVLVMQSFYQLPVKFFTERIHQKVYQWDACLSTYRNSF